MTTQPTQLAQVRNLSKEIVTRIKSDPNFARQAQDDPVGTLHAAGLPYGAVADFLREEGFGELRGRDISEEEFIAGAIANPNLACRWTCLCTPCCLSGRCWITI